MNELLIPVPGADAMSDGDARRICSKGSGPIALFKAEGAYHAIADKCTHGDASLSEGWLEGHEIECPVHSGRFDIRSGAPLAFPVTAPVAVYTTRVVDEIVYVVIPV